MSVVVKIGFMINKEDDEIVSSKDGKKKRKIDNKTIRQVFSNSAIVSGIKDIVENVTDNITRNECWGSENAKERHESGGGVSMVFGAYSNAHGFTASDRKLIFAMLKKEEERKLDVKAYQKRTQAFIKTHGTKLEEIKRLPKEKKKEAYRSLASDFGYSEGRSGTQDDARLIEWLSEEKQRDT